METRKIGESHSASDIAEERNEICPMKNHDDYGRTYGRSQSAKRQRYQLSCKRLSKRKWRINKR